MFANVDDAQPRGIPFDQLARLKIVISRLSDALSQPVQRLVHTHDRPLNDENPSLRWIIKFLHRDRRQCCALLPSRIEEAI